MGRYLLDTGVLLDLLRGEPDTVAALHLLDDDDTVLISALTEMEIYACLGRMQPEEERVLRLLLSALETVSLDSAIARAAGTCWVRWGAHGSLSLREAVLAATASARGAILVTDGVTGGATSCRIPGLAVTTAAALREILTPR